MTLHSRHKYAVNILKQLTKCKKSAQNTKNVQKYLAVSNKNRTFAVAFPSHGMLNTESGMERTVIPPANWSLSIKT